MYVCHICARRVKFTLDGPIHWGGSAYLQRCEACGAESDTLLVSCPRCGATREWKDDHVVRPVTASYMHVKGGKA